MALERFVMRLVPKKAGADLAVQVDAGSGSAFGPKMPYAGKGATEDRVKLVLRLAERRGMLANAEWADRPAAFDGSMREFCDLAFDRNNRVGELVIADERDGMRLAMAVALAGKVSTVTARNSLTDGLVNLPGEAVMYWFTLCFYGRRRAAAKAALFTLLTAKGDR